ncbi:MAG: HU family DNA-binding protein [Ignavibacteria bacterium]|nr:HU family DNA-binding protein [Ignavibacteria bacterium]
MNRTELISGVSIQCGISRQEAELILDSMIDNISRSFLSEPVLKVKSFGEFKVKAVNSEINSANKIHFTPSEKLHSKANKIYVNLSPVRKVFDKNKLNNILNTFEVTEFKSGTNAEEKEDDVSDEIMNVEKTEEENELPERRLLPDKVIDLHNDIVNSGKPSDKKNLWG